MVILDHEKLLTQFQCHALALLTLQEAVRLLIVGGADSSQVGFLQSIQIELRQNYLDKPLPTPPTSTHPYYYVEEEEDNNNTTTPPPILELLVPKHIGQGMKYLEALKKHAATSSTSNSSLRHSPVA